jgi:SAM-dependent methyltransferase
LETFDGYHHHRPVFKFTHGVSFGRYLQLLRPGHVKQADLATLDQVLTNLRTEGVTEHGLDQLLALIRRQAGDPADVAWDSVRDMLVEKLESGEYLPPEGTREHHEWRKRVEKAIEKMPAIYNGEVGTRYGERYQQSPLTTLVSRLKDVFGYRPDGGGGERTALVVGCGPGQYALLLQNQGFRVELIDNSEQMLRLARKHLGLKKALHPRDLYNLERDYQEQFGRIDLVFACAIMVHVPRDRARDVLASFYKLLKPGGALFVNFKIADHTLIARDGRFFEYYRDHSLPWNLLTGAGFEIEEMVVRWNRLNMYHSPKLIHWANFYCRKPEGG